MTEQLHGPQGSPEPQPGTPEYVQRYAQLAMNGMMAAMDQRVQQRPDFDPTSYASDQVVILEAAVFYLRGPEVADASGSGETVVSSQEVKVHTHPPANDIADTREFTYNGKGWVTVQRGFGFPDPNLNDNELTYLQRVFPRVRQMAGLEDE